MKISPRKATSKLKIITLNRDNISTPHFWFILHEKTVTISKQKNGGDLEGQIKITRAAFNKFIDWYNKEQLIK